MEIKTLVEIRNGRVSIIQSDDETRVVVEREPARTLAGALNEKTIEQLRARVQELEGSVDELQTALDAANLGRQSNQEWAERAEARLAKLGTERAQLYEELNDTKKELDRVGNLSALAQAVRDRDEARAARDRAVAELRRRFTGAQMADRVAEEKAELREDLATETRRRETFERHLKLIAQTVHHPDIEKALTYRDYETFGPLRMAGAIRAVRDQTSSYAPPSPPKDADAEA